MAHTMKTGLTLLTAIIAASAGATDYATIAQPVVAYATNGNTSATLLALPAMIANTNEANLCDGQCGAWRNHQQCRCCNGAQPSNPNSHHHGQCS